MAVQRRLNCSPEQVFAVLRDGWTYPVWVVGASRMRSVDEGWPAPGTKLHHSFGVWPLLLNDTTEVLELDPGHRLVLEAGGWPIGNARVEITVEAAADGSWSRWQRTSGRPDTAGSSPGARGRHRRTQPRDAAPTRPPCRRPRLSPGSEDSIAERSGGIQGWGPRLSHVPVGY